MIEVRCHHPGKPGRRHTHITVLSEYGFLTAPNKAIRSIGPDYDCWEIICPWCRVKVNCRHEDVHLIARFVQANPTLLRDKSLELLALQSIMSRVSEIRQLAGGVR